MAQILGSLSARLGSQLGTGIAGALGNLAQAKVNQLARQGLLQERETERGRLAKEVEAGLTPLLPQEIQQFAPQLARLPAADRELALKQIYQSMQNQAYTNFLQQQQGMQGQPGQEQMPSQGEQPLSEDQLQKQMQLLQQQQQQAQSIQAPFAQQLLGQLQQPQAQPIPEAQAIGALSGVKIPPVPQGRMGGFIFDNLPLMVKKDAIDQIMSSGNLMGLYKTPQEQQQIAQEIEQAPIKPQADKAVQAKNAAAYVALSGVLKKAPELINQAGSLEEAAPVAAVEKALYEKPKDIASFLKSGAISPQQYESLQRINLAQDSHSRQWNQKWMDKADEKGTASREALGLIDIAENLVKSGKARIGAPAQLLNFLGVDAATFAAMPETQILDKLLNQIVMLGTTNLNGRLTNGILKQVQLTKGRIANSKEGLLGIVETMKPLMNYNDEFSRTVDDLASKYVSKNKALPIDFRSQVNKVMRSKEEELTQRSIKNLQKLGIKAGASLDVGVDVPFTLDSAKKYPGIEVDQNGTVYKSIDGRWTRQFRS